MDDDFVRDIEEAIEAHRQPWKTLVRRFSLCIGKIMF
jgi:hypothetical protein